MILKVYNHAKNGARKVATVSVHKELDLSVILISKILSTLLYKMVTCSRRGIKEREPGLMTGKKGPQTSFWLLCISVRTNIQPTH